MGIKVTTGYTATAGKDVTLTWKCSHCGASNRAVQRIEGIGQTGLFFGSPTNPNYRQDAQDCLIALMKELCKEKPSERYIDAEFSCKCRSCGKREPWAKLRYDFLKTVWKFIGYTVMFAFAFFVGELTPIPFLIYVAAMIWAAVHKPIHKSMMLKKIDAMPAESLPRITVEVNGMELELAPESKSPAPAKSEPPKPEPPKPVAPPKPVDPPKPVRIQPERKPASVLLTLSSGPRAGTVFRAAEGTPVIVGRNPSRCNLALSDYNVVSGRHCRLEVSSRGLMVTDLGSTNGTFVNGSRLTPNQAAPVKDGDELWLANRSCAIRVKYE